jgi:hypothetical protein
MVVRHLWRCSKSGARDREALSKYDNKQVESNAPLSCKAALAMSIPRNRTISRVWAQTDPLVTGRAENAVSLKLGYIRVGTKVLDTLLFGTLGASALRWWPGRAGLDRARGARDGGVRMGLKGLYGWRRR